ncbi:hypothetical protein BGZ94_004394 [Podila epigama]|nr:hypothetical protein BGZ94_004394 [Podila epigama]
MNDSTQRLSQAFELVFKSSPQEYTRLCTEFDPLGGLPRTWLVKGESGTGKTYLINTLSTLYNVDYMATITIGELAVIYPGDIVKGLRTFLGSVKYAAKAVVVLDNIELIFPRDDRDSALVHTLQEWIQTLDNKDSATTTTDASQQSRIMIIGTTQDAQRIDPSVQSYFDATIEMDVPTPEERVSILKACVKNHGISVLAIETTLDEREALARHSQSKIRSDPLEAISAMCHGYLPTDLDALCTRAGIVAFDRDGRSLDQVYVNDFVEAMKTIQISALRQNTSAKKVDPVYWTDIGGLQSVKEILEESVIWLYKHADAYTRLGIRPSKGVLLYGPPGTGKTMLAKAVATESEANFIALSIPELVKGEVGESEKAIARIFKTATRCSPCIVFLDELEAIFVLAATNHPEAIDHSILRPGRLDRLAYVPPPTFEERIAILEILRQGTRFSDNVDLNTVSNLTMNFTGADLKALVRKAGLNALKGNRSPPPPPNKI